MISDKSDNVHALWLILEHMSDAMALIRRGEHGFEYVFNNPAHQELTGFSLDAKQSHGINKV